jgi:hypothetical protein
MKWPRLNPEGHPTGCVVLAVGLLLSYMTVIFLLLRQLT